jgi:hypothetical protein
VITIILNPIGRGRFAAALDERVLCRSRRPFLDSARVLLAEGADPATPFAMRHAGSDYDALRSTIGQAAGLTVLEPDDPRDGRIYPRFARHQPWKGPGSHAIASPMRFSGPGLSDIEGGLDASQEAPRAADEVLPPSNTGRRS